MVIKDEYINYASGFFLTERIPMDHLIYGDNHNLYNFIDDHICEKFEYISAESLYETIEEIAEYLQMSATVKGEYLA